VLDLVTLGGALDAAAPARRECLSRLVHESAGRLIIDLSAVAHADVSCLAVLVAAGRQARLAGRLLRLAAAGRSSPLAMSAATG
jgi:anti-anti-sigma regulatory factor